MKMNLERMVEHLQETGKVYFPEGNVKEAIEELDRMGYEVHFDSSTDYLVLESIKNNETIDYCPECNVAYCQGRYTTGQCE